MLRRIHRFALLCYQRLPTTARRWVVRVIAPSYTVGAMVFIERDDGMMLLVSQTYRKGWGVPGGLLNRGEDAHDAAVREVKEEVGLDVELTGGPAVQVDAEAQRIDVIFRAQPVDGADLDNLEPMSPEITEISWFPITDLPDLQFETTGAFMELARLVGPRGAPYVPSDVS